LHGGGHCIGRGKIGGRSPRGGYTNDIDVKVWEYSSRLNCDYATTLDIFSNV